VSPRVNAIRNPGFSEGRAGPGGWVWSTSVKQSRWFRRPGDAHGEFGGMHVEIEQPSGDGFWSQTVVCKPKEYYRVEAVMRCALDGGDETTGFIIRLQPLVDDRAAGDPLITPGIHRTQGSFNVRAIFQAPDGVRRARISVGVNKARGSAVIHEVRFIRILEPDEVSHVMALPPPGHALSGAAIARQVHVCSATAAERTVTRILRTYLGEKNVSIGSPQTTPNLPALSALLLPDATPPSFVRSTTNLLKLASDRIVIISTSAFAALSNNVPSLRRIEQIDDPIHAKVVFADYFTRGFALHDVFSFAWEGRAGGSFVQHQFRKSTEFESFCKKLKLETFLASMCDKDVTSERPIGLFKLTKRGALFVLDIEPAECGASSRNEPVLAVHLLLSVLGRPVIGLGQFISPMTTETAFRGLMREMHDRFQHFTLHDEDVPTAEVTDQLVTIGGEDQSFGLPLKPKPVILVRSGLTCGDVESVYGAWLWFKQLIRMPPYTCPYVAQITSRYRLAWVPCVAAWAGQVGWRRSGTAPATEMDIDTEESELAAVIDIVSRPVNRVRVVVPSDHDQYARYAFWLPQVFESFSAGRQFALTVPDGATFSNRTDYAWRPVHHRLEVIANSEMLDDAFHKSAAQTGADIVRIEVPGCDLDFAAQSIHRTDVAATVLEHVIGLQHGLIAVNRQTEPAQLNGFSPVNAGEALIVDRHDPMLRESVSKAG